MTAWSPAKMPFNSWAISPTLSMLFTKSVYVFQRLPSLTALKSGAECQFPERYPDDVTVYTIGDVSKEICGGPHVTNTAKLGHFKIKKEEACSAGVRRIKAILD